VTRAGAPSLARRVVRAIDGARSDIVALSRHIHAHPELGYQERVAASAVAQMLRKHGYRVTMPLAGLPTALRAELPGAPQRPTIALLAEYDALPGLGHACGHNLIAAAAVGVALGMAAAAAEIPGRVVVIGTPAEEGGVDGAGGKVLLLERGVFRDVDAALLAHPSSRTVVASRSTAREALEVAFEGRAAHPVLSPGAGRSALDALLLTFNAVNALRGRLEDGVQCHGVITSGGTTPDVVPDHAVARFYVRAPTAELLSGAVERVRRCIEAAAQATDTRATVRPFSHTYLDLRPNPVLADLVQHSFERWGMRPEPAAHAAAGSTDMGNVSHALPSLHPYFAAGTEPHPTHTAAFARLAGSAAAHRSLLVAVKALATACLELLVEPEALCRAWRAFRGDVSLF